VFRPFWLFIVFIVFEVILRPVAGIFIFVINAGRRLRLLRLYWVGNRAKRRSGRWRQR
jgi:hypothetical protein